MQLSHGAQRYSPIIIRTIQFHGNMNFERPRMDLIWVLLIWSTITINSPRKSPVV
jgi:hypothetical protein